MKKIDAYHDPNLIYLPEYWKQQEQLALDCFWDGYDQQGEWHMKESKWAKRLTEQGYLYEPKF